MMSNSNGVSALGVVLIVLAVLWALGIWTC